MATKAAISLRELAHRNSDGIDVRLLWDPRTDDVTVTVQDERTDDSFELAVQGANALNAFHHPYAYAEDLHAGRQVGAARAA